MYASGIPKVGTFGSLRVDLVDLVDLVAGSIRQEICRRDFRNRVGRFG